MEIAVLLQGPKSSENKPSSYWQHNDTTSLFHQYQLVQSRGLKLYWRSPVYIRGKFVLNLLAGLFIGFTFYQEKNSAQGLQNKMFATFTSLVLSARTCLPSKNLLSPLFLLASTCWWDFGIALMNQLQPLFFRVRNLYQSREEPTKMYHWSIFVFATVGTEILINIITGTLFFIPWFFAVGFRNEMSDPNGRGAYMYILFVSQYSLSFSLFPSFCY